LEGRQRLKNLTPSLLWGDLAARATLGGLHMMDSSVVFKGFFGLDKSFSLIIAYFFVAAKFCQPAMMRVAVVNVHRLA
jgi:hypothetical protein